MKKILVSILTVVILYNAILPNLFYNVNAQDSLTMDYQPNYVEITNDDKVETPERRKS